MSSNFPHSQGIQPIFGGSDPVSVAAFGPPARSIFADDANNCQSFTGNEYWQSLTLKEKIVGVSASIGAGLGTAAIIVFIGTYL